MLAKGLAGRAIRDAGIAGQLHAFDPEVVILGGHIADSGADLLVGLRGARCSRRAAGGRSIGHRGRGGTGDRAAGAGAAKAG
ncbi:hypothetical protein SBA4_920014 [Candidatus Sulfopaludibacter sp. SbA4]|nr:hypothetical protein SBA4_920014 [Candidatus Sulfopaludibacter sp. SbA4]